MKVIRIAVCDDEEYYLEELDKMLSVYGNEAESEVAVTRYQKPKKLVEEVKAQPHQYDMIYLDVEMPGVSGVDAAKEIRKVNTDVIICFATSHTSYALDAYGVDAIGYVVKPINYTDVKRIMERARGLIYYQWDYKQAEQAYLSVSTGREEVLVELKKVVYIEKRRNRCVFHLKDAELACYDTLSHVYERLDGKQFLFTHQGYIANFDYIKEVKKDVVCFGDGIEIPISRKYYQSVRDLHLDKIYRYRSKLAQERSTQ